MSVISIYGNSSRNGRMPDSSQALGISGEGTLKVLVADDEDIARRTLAIMLESSGYIVIDARDGVEAVQKATRELPDVILMDIAMPIMDGFQAAERLRANPRTAAIPIVACTGVSRPFDQELFQAVISKPFTAEDVIAQVKAVVQQVSHSDR
ncbi:MAG TPA: response regulator [Steroidobacteraceae bacterium]